MLSCKCCYYLIVCCFNLLVLFKCYYVVIFVVVPIFLYFSIMVMDHDFSKDEFIGATQIKLFKVLNFYNYETSIKRLLDRSVGGLYAYTCMPLGHVIALLWRGGGGDQPANGRLGSRASMSEYDITAVCRASGR